MQRSWVRAPLMVTNRCVFFYIYKSHFSLLSVCCSSASFRILLNISCIPCVTSLPLNIFLLSPSDWFVLLTGALPLFIFQVYDIYWYQPNTKLFLYRMLRYRFFLSIKRGIKNGIFLICLELETRTGSVQQKCYIYHQD